MTSMAAHASLRSLVLPSLRADFSTLGPALMRAVDQVEYEIQHPAANVQHPYGDSNQ